MNLVALAVMLAVISVIGSLIGGLASERRHHKRATLDAHWRSVRKSLPGTAVNYRKDRHV